MPKMSRKIESNCNKKDKEKMIASLHQLRSLRSLHITADKRLRYALPKLPSATSFIRKTLGETWELKNKEEV